MDGCYDSLADFIYLNSNPALTTRNQAFKPQNAKSFFVYSYDPGRDLMYTSANNVGQSNAQLLPKFNVNGITNTPEWQNSLTVANGGYIANFQNQYHYLNFSGTTPATPPASAGNPSSAFISYYNNLIQCISGQGPFANVTPLYEDPMHWKYVAANLINYLDPDRIPQIIQTQETDYQYEDDQGAEDTPLISEVCLQKVAGSGTNNIYEVVVELWYIYYPNTVETTDGFGLLVAVTTNTTVNNGRGFFISPGPDISGDQNANDIDGWWDIHGVYNSPNSFEASIGPMSYFNYDGQHPQFRCYTSPVANRISFPGEAPISTSHPVYFEAQIIKVQGNIAYNPSDSTRGPATSMHPSGGNYYIINQAMARNANNVGPTEFTNEWDYQVNDPRANCMMSYWMSPTHTPQGSGWDGPATNNTLGRTNVCSTPWSATVGDSTYIKSGLPLFWRDGPMETIGEIGHIPVGDVAGEYEGADWPGNVANWFWEPINLMSYDYGAFLLDRMTVRDTNSWYAGLPIFNVASSPTLNPAYGLVNLNTSNTNVLLALYNNMGIGVTNSSGQYQQTLSASDPNVQALASAIISQPNGPYWSFQSLFTSNNMTESGDSLPTAYQNVVQDTSGVGQINEIQRQDPIRKILDFISFRQNIFMIVAVAQQLAPDGVTICSEERAMTTFFRDAYTGQSSILTNYYYQNDSVGDGISDWWRSQYFGGDGTATNAMSCATADPDGDGMDNLQEYLAGTDPTNPNSVFRIVSPDATGTTGFVVRWTSEPYKFYSLMRSTNLVSGFDCCVSTGIAASPPTNTCIDNTTTGAPACFYRVRM
jgi:hypothetical protein